MAYLRDSEGFFADEIINVEDRKKLYVGEAILNSQSNGDQTIDPNGSVQ